MREKARSGVRDSVLQIAAAAASVPVVIGFTLLGATVVIGRGLASVLSRLLPLVGAGESAPRHHVGRVRDQVSAAEEAARIAGVLRRRR